MFGFIFGSCIFAILYLVIIVLAVRWLVALFNPISQTSTDEERIAASRTRNAIIIGGSLFLLARFFRGVDKRR